jgi:hypothetical protein
MANSFLFIIPLTPVSKLTSLRKELRNLCITSLNAQDYSNWKALLIGIDVPVDNNEKFIYLNYEGHKEEKLQIASQYILDNNMKFDYIIRLDDDDIFNPGLLKKLQNTDADVFVDRYHTFWNVGSGQVAQKVMYWFPNTCIHRSTHALKEFGNFPPGEYKRFRNRSRLIEVEHNDFHLYYNQKHVIGFAEPGDPVYLRVLNPDSITSSQSDNYEAYLDRYGYWHTNDLKAYTFLNKTCLTKNNSFQTAHQSFVTRIKKGVQNLKAIYNYRKLVINKSTF